MNVFAKFYDRVVKTDEVDKKTGLPVFKEVCFVEIRLKNNTTDIVDQPATEEKKQRFKKEYELYLQSKEELKEGTALSLFAFLTPLEIETLKVRGIFSLEDFSKMTKNQAEDLGLVKEWEKADEFLKLYKNQADIKKLKEELNKMKEKLSLLQSKVKRKKQG